MMKLIKLIFLNLKIIITINKISKINFKIVFFSESKNYQKYSHILLDYLIAKFPNQILYASSDLDDKIKDYRVINLYVGKKSTLQYFFSKIKCRNLFTTTTDLNNNIMIKTNNVKNYIYYFHSPVSTTRVYTTKAFDYFDTILSIGEFQKKELKKREELKKLPKKKIIQTGYFYFDTLKNNLNINNYSDKILVAPSWNYNEKYFINEDFYIIIDSLIKNNFNVIFRPHPEHFKRSKNFINKIRENFIDKKTFFFDEERENIKSMENAKLLITDNSGIAIEYCLILKKPVYYYSSKKKIHNGEVEDYNNMLNLEDIVKEKFGYYFDKNELKNFYKNINSHISNFDKSKKLEIDDFLNNHFYNIGKTNEYLYTHSNKFIL